MTLLVVSFISFFLCCHRTAVESQLTSSPDDPTIANETSDLTLMWKYNAVGSIIIATFGHGVGDRIARKIGANDIMVEAKYQDRYRANISESQAWLKILRVQRSDEGEYNFRLEPDSGNTISGRLDLIVHFSPTLFNNVSGEQSVTERSDLNLYCGVSGKPVSSITWTRVFENGSESQVFHIGTSWKIASINQTDTGKYCCTAYNGIGSPVSHTIPVKVLFPPKIVNFVQEYNVAVKQSVTLQCQAEGYPEPTFTWRPSKDSCNVGTLTIPEVLNDAVYTCTVTNSEGSNSADASIVIADKTINVTMKITSESCTDGQYNDCLLSTRISDALKEVFFNKSNYISATVRNVRCGSLIVDLGLRFSSIVTEKRVLNILKEAAKDGTFGEFSVEASSIIGARPANKSTKSPDGGTPTPITHNVEVCVGCSCNCNLLKALVGVFAAVIVVLSLYILWLHRKGIPRRARSLKEMNIKEERNSLEMDMKDFQSGHTSLRDNISDVSSPVQYMALDAARRSNDLAESQLTKDASELSQYAPLNLSTLSFEIPRENVTIEKIIGQGSFGQVAKGTVMSLHGRPQETLVAIKMLKGMSQRKESS